MLASSQLYVVSREFQVLSRNDNSCEIFSVDRARGARGSAISALTESLDISGRRVGYYFYRVVVCAEIYLPHRFFLDGLFFY